MRLIDMGPLAQPRFPSDSAGDLAEVSMVPLNGNSPSRQLPPCTFGHAVELRVLYSVYVALANEALGFESEGYGGKGGGGHGHHRLSVATPLSSL